MNIILAAGGTGGHMTPAHSLAEELKKRGHGVALVTDERGTRFPGLFEGVPVHVLPAGRLGGGPIGMVRAFFSVLKGKAAAKALYGQGRIDAVVGFGGYPAYPALSAANALGIPTILHEQNAVLGRVNRLLAGKAKAIATSYAEVDRVGSNKGKCVLVGNPVREAVRRLGEMPFPPLDDTAPLKILVTGGSQGASILSEVVPEGLTRLVPRLRHRLQVVQQCREGEIEKVRAHYADNGIPAELMTYIEDMPARLGEAHLVIARAGASTIAELTAAGRPAILVPLPIATDDHQTVNAREMSEAGGARTVPQPRFTPDVLAEQVAAIAGEPDALANAASRALSVGRPNATRDLADLVERVAGGLAPIEVGSIGRPLRAAPRAVGVPA